jgi:hypothetical protein
MGRKDYVIWDQEFLAVVKRRRDSVFCLGLCWLCHPHGYLGHHCGRVVLASRMEGHVVGSKLGRGLAARR